MPVLRVSSSFQKRAEFKLDSKPFLTSLLLKFTRKPQKSHLKAQEIKDIEILDLLYSTNFFMRL